MVRLGYCLLLGCLLTLVLDLSSFGQSTNVRARDRQSRVRNTTNRPGSSRSTGQFPARGLPAEFAILNTRTIFARGLMAANAPNPRAGSQRLSAPTAPSPIFRGVINEIGGNRLAGIERGTSSITWYREGQSLSNGDRITQISLDQITITQRNGDRRSIAVGDRLDAGTAVARDSSRNGAVTKPADPPLLLSADSDAAE